MKEQWRAKPGRAFAVRVLAFALPLAGGYVVGAAVAAALGTPVRATQVIGWWALVIGSATVAATLVDRIARRLIPLSTLLKMSMVFPDAAPSRFRVALRSGNLRRLRREASSARSTGLGESSELVLSLATALSKHDRRTRGHSERTRAYTELLAEELGLSVSDRSKLRWAALLHDVGKLEVPIETLNKSGPLDAAEWRVVREHPIAGMRLISPLLPWLGEWGKTVEHHHERWDGTGYPHGLAGTDIAFGARIVAVADSFDVMTSGRSYQAAMSAADARAEIAEHAGQQFDPDVARALLNVSLSRLKKAIGPLAGLAQIPGFGRVPRLANDLAIVGSSASAVLTAAVTAMVVVASLGGPTAVEPDPGATILATSDSASPAAEVAAPPILEAASSAETQEDDDADDIGTTDAPSAGPDATQGEGMVAQSAPPPPSTTPASTAGAAPAPARSTTTTTTVPSTSTSTSTPEPATTTTTAPSPTTVTTIVAAETPPPPPPPPLPAAPTAADDEVAMLEDQSVAISVLTNDRDRDGDLDTASLAIVSSPRFGVASVLNGVVAYESDPDRFGVDSFTYEVCDEGRRCDSANVTIHVVAVDDAPRPVDDTGATVWDEPVTIDVLANDGEVDGEPLVVKLNGAERFAPNGGPVASVVDNRVLLVPTPGIAGVFEIAYEACDPGGNCAGAGLSVNVEPTTTAVNDEFVVGTTGATLDVIDNDHLGSGAFKTLEVVTPPSSGTASVDGTTIFYAPDAAGTADELRYRLCDTADVCDEATATIGVITTTLARPDVAETNGRAFVDIDVRANDIAGSGRWAAGPLRLITEPTSGAALVRNGRVIRYVPDPGYEGTVEFEYEICDSTSSCDTARVVVTAEGRTVAADDTAATAGRSRIDIDVRANDTPGSGSWAGRSTLSIVEAPGAGTAVPISGRQIRYAVTPGFVGEDSFTYRACDGAGYCDTAAVTIDAGSSLVANDDEVATDGRAATVIDVRANDTTDAGGWAPRPTLTIVTEAEHGRATVIDRRRVRYEMTDGYVGQDVFTYSVCDSAGYCDTASVSVSSSTGLVALDDRVSTGGLARVVIDVRSNDVTSAGGWAPAPTIELIRLPESGLAEVIDRRRVRYEPRPGFLGSETLEYRVCDAAGYCDTAEVTIDVLENAAPEAADDRYEVQPGTETGLDVTANDSDRDGDPLTVSLVTSPSNGEVRVDDLGTPDPSDDEILYRAAIGYSGLDEFDYRVRDSYSRCDRATVTITVQPLELRLRLTSMSWTSRDTMRSEYATKPQLTSNSRGTWSAARSAVQARRLQKRTPSSRYRSRATTAQPAMASPFVCSGSKKWGRRASRSRR